MSNPLPDGYRLVDGPPSTGDYLELRERAGLSPKRADQAEAALLGSWATCHVLHDGDDHAVAMGRLIGDGGWYFHVVDMAVLAAHQRRGLGSRVLTWLLDRVAERAPAGAYVSLMADPPGRALYARHGFTEDRTASVGMARWL